MWDRRLEGGGGCRISQIPAFSYLAELISTTIACISLPANLASITSEIKMLMKNPSLMTDRGERLGMLEPAMGEAGRV